MRSTRYSLTFLPFQQNQEWKILCGTVALKRFYFSRMDSKLLSEPCDFCGPICVEIFSNSHKFISAKCVFHTYNMVRRTLHNYRRMHVYTIHSHSSKSYNYTNYSIMSLIISLSNIDHLPMAYIFGAYKLAVAEHVRIKGICCLRAVVLI